MATSDDTQTQQTVADPEEFNQQRRLASIHDARDRARVAYEKIRDPELNGAYRQHAEMYRATVENYIGEIEPLAVQYEFGDSEPNYWEAHSLGEVVLPLPDELRQLYHDDDVRVLGDGIDRERRTVTGLEGYLEAPPTFTTNYEIMVQEHGKRPKPRRAEVTMGMPVDVSYRAFRAVNKFLALAGIDIELQPNDNPRITNFDQSGESSTADLVRDSQDGVPL